MNSTRSSVASAFTILLFAFVLGWVLSPALQAAAPKSAPKPPPDTRVLVTAVDEKNQQITITHQKSKTTKVYSIDDMTKVVIQGNAGTFAGIKAGQQVYSYVERDDKSLDSIEVAVAQPAPVAATKTPPKKTAPPAASSQAQQPDQQ